MNAINPFVAAPDRALRAKTAAPAVAVRAATVEEGPNYVGIYASSIFAMTLLFLVGVGVPVAMAYGNAVGLATGAFCAFWGGVGFGVMAGGARVSTWHDKHDAHD